ncbi:MAG TPA: acyltransferase [Candidatus Acidoferrum sp.]|nr:acyltransferase [Candidatus Acidoferrum sp.]
MTEPKQTGAPGGQTPLLRSHMPELDTIRGLAILGVILYHGFYWAHDLTAYTPWQRIFLKAMSVGQYGVNLFFVLSGFLITGILLNTRDRKDYYKRFYLRRALRILPAYYLTLLILVIFGLTSKGFLLMSLLYSSNLSLLFGITMSYTVLWSLAVEEHFYLVWPAAVRKMSPRGLLALGVSLIVVSPGLRFCCGLLPAKYAAIVGGCSYYTWNSFDGLALGAVMALLVRRMNDDRMKLLRFSLGLIGLGLLIAAAGYPFGIITRMNPVGEALQWVPWHLGLGGFLGILVVVGSGKWKTFAAPRILTFFGAISYGLYLYHLLFLFAYNWLLKRTGFAEHWNLSPWGRTWLSMLVSSTAAILFSYLSRWYFEEPFLRLKDRWETPADSSRESKVGEAIAASETGKS